MIPLYVSDPHVEPVCLSQSETSLKETSEALYLGL